MATLPMHLRHLGLSRPVPGWVVVRLPRRAQYCDGVLQTQCEAWLAFRSMKHFCFNSIEFVCTFPSTTPRLALFEGTCSMA